MNAISIQSVVTMGQHDCLKRACHIVHTWHEQQLIQGSVPRRVAQVCALAGDMVANSDECERHIRRMMIPSIRGLDYSHPNSEPVIFHLTASLVTHCFIAAFSTSPGETVEDMIRRIGKYFGRKSPLPLLEELVQLLILAPEQMSHPVHHRGPQHHAAPPLRVLRSFPQKTLSYLKEVDPERLWSVMLI